MRTIVASGYFSSFPLKCVECVVVLLAALSPAGAAVLYFNDFQGPVGSNYPEWTSSPINFVGTAVSAGTLPAPAITNIESPNHRERFLGEFGGPPIGKPGDIGYNRTRVEQAIVLTLTNLPAHAALRLTFDLYVLKPWDGNSPAYGPDRWQLLVDEGPMLLDTTFSNNPKEKTEGSTQQYPKPGSHAGTGAVSRGTLGYDNFFKDSIYHLEFNFPHKAPRLRLIFRSDLFEGKGTADESWGLDIVRIETAAAVNP
jgi:hypothetical protein